VYYHFSGWVSAIEIASVEVMSKTLIKLTGKTFKELKPFLSRMREERKNGK